MKRALLSLLLLSGCADMDFRRDNAGYVLPKGSLAGTSAIVYVHTQEDLERHASLRGFDMAAVKRRGGKLLGFQDRALNPACVIHLGDTPDGLQALKHELAHCKWGAWHD